MAQRATKIAKAEQIVGFTFPDQQKDLLWSALQFNNLEMAVGGDAPLKLAIVEDSIRTGLAKGAIQERVSRVGSNANLDRVARLAGLEACIVPHPGQQDQIPSTKTVIATFEAILWAVYLASGDGTTIVKTVMNTTGLWPEV